VGCNGAQGFLFARPQPDEAILAWLAAAPVPASARTSGR